MDDLIKKYVADSNWVLSIKEGASLHYIKYGKCYIFD